jgi:hypothetical protein
MDEHRPGRSSTRGVCRACAAVRMTRAGRHARPGSTPSRGDSRERSQPEPVWQQVVVPSAPAQPTWQQVVTTVAAAAGGAAWVSAVGSGVIALRLRQAELPVEPIVALMSTEHRFAVGAGILIAPLLAGFIGFLADWVARTRFGLRLRKTRAAATVLAGGVVVYAVLRPQFATFAFECATVALIVPLTFRFLRDRAHPHSFHECIAVFVAALVAAGAGAIFAESQQTPSFDEATIRTLAPPGSLISGLYITTTEHSVVLSPRCEVVLAVPREQIARITVGPGEQTRSACPGP